MMPVINLVPPSILPPLPPFLIDGPREIELLADNSAPLPPRDVFVSSAKIQNPVEKKPEYRWIVDVAGVVGAVVGFVFGGPVGAVVGGTIGAALAVPLRRFLAGTDPNDPNELGLAGETAITAGSSLLFGAIFMGMGAVVRVFASRASAFFASRASSTLASRPLLRKGVEILGKAWTPFKEWYVKKGHVPIRAAAAVPVVYDLTHNKNGKLDLTDMSIDTPLGFATALYAGNGVYSKLFGSNVFGLDTAAPLSMASYQLFRLMAGAKASDFSDFNYNQALRFRYVAEIGNNIQSMMLYGKAYWDIDFRMEKAVQKGLTANTNTGTKTKPLLAPAFDALAVAYRYLVPRPLKRIIRPTIDYPVGPLAGSGLNPAMADRLTILTGFNGNDMMRPQFETGGRLVSLGQTWGVVVPWQFLSAPLLGMTPAQWGQNRFWKMTTWSYIGNPIKAGLGGDTSLAQWGGFATGMTIDAGVTVFYNPRADKKHWAWDLHESLAAFRQHPEQQDAIADHVMNEIFNRQMTDWDLKSFVSLKGLHRFNSKYLRTFDEEVAALSAEERESLEKIYQKRLASGDDFGLRELGQILQK
ncbi:MAG: hypothetical protein HY877_02335 [Deltaproteobacteria bacterium]|nr:hypothetical protein [Deltaproteobacteria bacterium]